MQGRNSTFQDSFNRGGDVSRTKSAVRWAVDDDDGPADRNGTMDRLQISNTSTFQIDRNNGNSLTVGMGHSTTSAASNPQAKINRNRTMSKTFSTLELQFKLQQQDKYDTLSYKLGKSFFAIFVMLIVVAAMILSKTSLLYMATKGNVKDKKEFPRYVVQILFVIILPLVFTCLSDLLYFWVRETKEKKRDPKAVRVRPHAVLLLSMVEGVIEAGGNAIFVMMVLPNPDIDALTKIFLLNGLCVIPVLSGMIMKWKKWTGGKQPGANPHNDGTDMELREMEGGSMKESKRSKGGDVCSRIVVTGVQILFLGMQLAGMALFMLKFKIYWEIPTSLILSSISWWKNYVFIDRLDAHWTEAFKRNRYASSFTKTLTKIVAVIIATVVILKVKYDMNASDVLGSSHIGPAFTTTAMYYNILGSFVSYYLVWLACLACLQKFCVALPVLLTTPLTLFLQSYSCHTYIFGAAKVGSCDSFYYTPLKDGMIIVAGILLWISFIIISGHLWQGVDKRDANQLEEDMWAQPEGTHCVFNEQSIALNRNRNPKVVKSLDGDVEYGYHAHRTYITTTMYHETKTEMTKLVMSLLQIDAEIPTEDKVADYYEAHIIFDDAFMKQPNPKPDHFDYSPFYNQWVFYLLDIFQELKLKRLGDAVVVWYGEVLTFKFSLGMKLVVHLKDVSKIRQKKRWSQILYMHCILEDVLDNENKLGMLDSNTFILMIDGDTQFSRKSINMMRHMIELDRERSGAICGRIFPEGASNPVVWYQKFEYAVGHWFQKTAEHVFGTVLCSPGCFSLVRIAALYRKSGESMDNENVCAIETYAVEVNSAMDVLKFDQGEDRMLSTLIIKNGWRLQYCAGAEAGTFCPEGFGDFFKQRRRWISSTLANLYFLIASSGDIIKTNTSVSPPFILYTAGVFASSIFGPATIMLVVMGGVGYAFNWTGVLPIIIGIGFPAAYALLCIIFNLDMETDTPRKKSKKIDIQVAGAFILCALYALLMAAVAVGITASIVGEPDGVSAIYLYTLIATMAITAWLHGELWLLIYGVVYLFLLPTMYLILIMFAVANIHDQSWGTRDSSSGSKETDADRFFSITKVAVYIRDLRKSFREALADESTAEVSKEDLEDKWRNPNYWKKNLEDDGKEEMIFLEEERRKLEEERKRQEEEKKKAEEERKLREIERQKEEARKKKLEAEEREKLQEKLKQERRRGINHRYKDQLSSLSRRLKAKVATPEKGNDKDIAAQKLEQIRALAQLQQLSCFMLFLVTVIWLILVVVVSIHPELRFINTNAVGIMFLIAFGIISILQFFASIAHRFETMFNALANIPMTADCGFIDRGKKYERLMALKQQAETGEAVPREGVASKVARKLLMVDKRTATKANLQFGQY